jgi:sialic acid synthase SpsE
VNNLICVGDKVISNESPCFIIAEIGSNHNQVKEWAYKLIDMAIEAGVDAVKFQTLKASDIASKSVLANAYGESQITKGKEIWSEVLEDLVLPFEWHKELFDYAKKNNMIVFSTPESVEAVDLLEKLEVPMYKIASMDITYKELLISVAKTRKPVILSSGVADFEDIYKAISVLKKYGSDEIALLHCVSDYPPDYDVMSLSMMQKYKSIFDMPVGLSDHCDENTLDGVAVALGAKIIEKHITLDRNMDGPDHKFALEINRLKDLVKIIRTVERAIPINEKLFDSKTNKKREYSRSVIALNDMKAGQKVSLVDFEYKRPGFGISPMDVDIINGLTLTRSVTKGHIFMWEDFK